MADRQDCGPRPVAAISSGHELEIAGGGYCPPPEAPEARTQAGGPGLAHRARSEAGQEIRRLPEASAAIGSGLIPAGSIQARKLRKVRAARVTHLIRLHSGAVRGDQVAQLGNR
ncbi:MAG: hypothetical protein JOY71_23365 [Acetobacteraceae bacterium]|nr:hypothetical protein [Acetobacteraceae bacterium]MBV8525023.1 hypothetical protein [Acetobacteraceae bacterium]MBV8591062.1 hypothetical protein [Acetobacteraceae bacterium]